MILTDYLSLAIILILCGIIFHQWKGRRNLFEQIEEMIDDQTKLRHQIWGKTDEIASLQKAIGFKDEEIRDIQLDYNAQLTNLENQIQELKEKLGRSIELHDQDGKAFIEACFKIDRLTEDCGRYQQISARLAQDITVRNGIIATDKLTIERLRQEKSTLQRKFDATDKELKTYLANQKTTARSYPGKQ